jgi:preprotein translocase subunit SecE
MNKIVAYLQDVRSELVTKTSWPTWSELTNSAVIVMVASVIIAGIVFVMDFGFEKILEQVYRLLN